ncbi:long-chain-fatty-acid--CoA ligase [Natrinema sp. 1APR25-10V2]|uniref:class I adenylate-forming enzyme family protein n=1 Tax=Natrinema sp. 1APR25-10V2 TaxID=2951081 RepID=UPI0028771F57|nr:long-chain-fatty-acid--CoA ligase [Natrinema sp. 1APR25-10V2]MDS0474434.1 long-chain-fatty-acid--CoA ligase [Natrinema sp. 1APR25-10V2]
MSEAIATSAATEPGSTLKDAFETGLRKYAERTAVVDGDRTLTYRELDRRANAVARGLVEHGVGVGDRVALVMSNRLEYVVADLAVIKAGAAKLPLNDMLTAEEFEYMLRDSGAGTVVCGPNFADTIASIRDDLPDLETVVGIEDASPEGFVPFADLDGDEPDPPEQSPTVDDVAGHYYTGGTTGKPKGVLHTHDGITTNVYAHIVELGVTGDDTLLLMTPLPHSAGMFLWSALLTGATAVIRPGFEPEAALELIERHAVTWTFMVPTMIYRVLDHPDLESADASSLETLAYGAAPMTPARLREGLEAFGPVFLQFYGQTEVPNVITTFGKEEHRRAVETDRDERLSSAGQSCLMADVRIVDAETGDPDDRVATGESGEILARSPYAMAEYYERPDATAETIVDGWVRTGDIGRRDEDGYVYLLDRASDLIISGGMNVYSTEVEEALDEHEGIAEVAVIGVPDDDWGEAVKAVVVPRGDASLTEDELLSFADERLADYKKPKSVDFREEIPKTPYGKMDKKALREPYWEDEERAVG